MDKASLRLKALRMRGNLHAQDFCSPVLTRHHLLNAAQNWLGPVGLGSFASMEPSQNRSATGGVYLSVEVGESCNLSCRHCIYGHQQSSQRPPNKIVADGLANALESGFDPLWISYAGREPTLFPETLATMARLSRRPDRLNILMTNGFRLPEIREVVELMNYVDVSIDGNEQGHDWMRGPGTFRRTWNNLAWTLANTTVKVAVIATLVKGRLPDGREQYEAILELARRLHLEFGEDSRISLSISLYFGLPGDLMIVGKEEVVALMRSLQAIGFPSRVLFTANYTHLWPQVAEDLGWISTRPEYDEHTGFPIFRSGTVSAVIFNMTEVPQIGLRLTNEGKVFLGCNHLVLGDGAAGFDVGNLSLEKLQDIADRASSGDHSFSSDLEFVAEDCLQCEQWGQCRGGDRLSGIYFRGLPVDPYCPKIQWRGLPA